VKIDEIAAEAAREAFIDDSRYTINSCDIIMLQLTESDLRAIIKAAIEKAIDEERKRDKKDYFPFTPKDWPT
jgi:hypothetical protein